MSRKLVLGVVLIFSLIASVACSGGGGTKIKATVIQAQVANDSAAIPVSEVQSKTNTKFKVNTTAGNVSFMAYQLDGKLWARADICPPCRSESFSLAKDRLICDACGTVFNAATGDGIRGACVAYPKAAVPYQVSGDSVSMKGNDLATAYQNTLEPGWP